MKQKILTGITTLMLAGALAGCAGTAGAAAQADSFDSAKPIAVVTREEGSGTRGAFIELMGIQEKTADGGKVDRTTKEAETVNKTDVMLTSVSGNAYSIGYLSLGSLNDSVKALEIDGAKATAENVKNGSYKVARPFHIAVKGEVDGLAKDFIDFIMSGEGQQVVQDNGYIKVADNAPAFAGSKPAGKITLAGSSSVTPVMEKLKEAYLALNPAASIEIQQSDSTAGMTAVAEGICDIGMASRELKEEELSVLTAMAIANDGIAVITSPANPVVGLSSEQVKAIFTGEAKNWNELAG